MLTYNEWVETVEGLDDVGSEVDQDVPLYGEDGGIGLQEEEGEKIAGDEKRYQHGGYHHCTALYWLDENFRAEE